MNWMNAYMYWIYAYLCLELCLLRLCQKNGKTLSNAYWLIIKLTFMTKLVLNYDIFIIWMICANSHIFKTIKLQDMRDLLIENMADNCRKQFSFHSIWLSCIHTIEQFNHNSYRGQHKIQYQTFQKFFHLFKQIVNFFQSLNQ
jgi:hypothetical protein